MTTLDQYPLAEMKRIYRLLHGHLTEDPELMDSDFLHDLQRHLQACAARDGVDVSMHADWAAWLDHP